MSFDSGHRISKVMIYVFTNIKRFAGSAEKVFCRLPRKP